VKRAPIEKPGRADRIVLEIGPFGQEDMAGAARVLARLAVEKALQELGLDIGRATGDTVGNQHKEAPPSVRAPDEAKERVL
jgi:hypothetical protein